MTEEEISRQITRYIKDELTDSEVDELWIEFLKNPEMFEQFEVEYNIADLFINKGYSIENDNNTVREPVTKKYRGWIYAAAAAVLIAVGIQFFITSQTDSISKYAVAKIDSTELLGADVYRTDDEDVEEMDIELNKALALALNEESKTAILQFENLLDESPNHEQKVRIYLNLGILRYNNAEYEQSTKEFLKLLEINNLPEHVEEAAWWFLGNAQLNLQNLEDARDSVFNAYQLDGRFNEPALSLLNRIDQELEKENNSISENTM